MRIYQLDPTKDARWAEFIHRHPKASVFHNVEWLQTLRLTYGYEPVVFTTSPPTGELKNGLVFCDIKSWLTGRRLVSLPFSDHCDPLCDSAEDLSFMIRYLSSSLEHRQWNYLELRPVNEDFIGASEKTGLLPTARYLFHVLDLRPRLDDLFKSLDKNSVQRRVRRAGRAGLVERCGRSEELLRDFYSLIILTRRRYHVPPMPYIWFQHLITCHGDALEIRVAYKDEVPISALLTLRFKETVIYKYGCSNKQFHRFGATPWLLWRAIVNAKSNGVMRFDMGRTEEGNEGLCVFKNHWDHQPKRSMYWRFPGTPTLDSTFGHKLDVAKRVFSLMPGPLLKITGQLLYRHIG